MDHQRTRNRVSMMHKQIHLVALVQIAWPGVHQTLTAVGRAAPLGAVVSHRVARHQRQPRRAPTEGRRQLASELVEPLGLEMMATGVRTAGPKEPVPARIQR